MLNFLSLRCHSVKEELSSVDPLDINNKSFISFYPHRDGSLVILHYTDIPFPYKNIKDELLLCSESKTLDTIDKIISISKTGYMQKLLTEVSSIIGQGGNVLLLQYGFTLWWDKTVECIQLHVHDKEENNTTISNIHCANDNLACGLSICAISILARMLICSMRDPSTDKEIQRTVQMYSALTTNTMQ